MKRPVDPDKLESFAPATRTAWRKWLQKNHTSRDFIWLVLYHKDSGKSTLDYHSAVEEALCFGWIDSKPNKRDDHSFYLFMAKRKPRSNWSKANRERAEKMIRGGLMTPAGLAMIDLAKKNGTWKALQDVQNNVIPGDLKKAFSRNKKAFANFDQFPPSSKRIILEWILNAKRPETRSKRIAETVSLAGKNIRANHYRQ